jgi:hypothetical protein
METVLPASASYDWAIGHRLRMNTRLLGFKALN